MVFFFEFVPVQLTLENPQDGVNTPKIDLYNCENSEMRHGRDRLSGVPKFGSYFTSVALQLPAEDGYIPTGVRRYSIIVILVPVVARQLNP